MTPTPNPTAEQIIADAITAYWADEERSGPNRGPASHDFACGEAAAAALRAHGLLSEGADPSRQEIPLVCLGFESGSTFAVTGENAGHWVEGSPTHTPITKGAPSEEQIERATQSLWQYFNPGFAPIGPDHPDYGFYREAALTAAGVAPQAPVNPVATSPERVKSGGDSLHVLDPVKVAEVLNQHEPIFKDGQYAGRCICGFEHPSYSGWRLHRSGAIREAHKEGRLT